MSYDYSVWLPIRELSSHEAAKIHVDLCQGRQSDLLSATESIDAFLSEVVATFPDIDDYDDEDVDDCPWNSGFDRSDSHVILCASYSRIEEVETLLRSAAEKHGLTLFNPQTGELYSPSRSASAKRKWWRVITGGG